VGGGGMSAPARLLDKDQAALVVVDLQEKLLPAISGKERVLKNSLLLMKAAELLAVPVVLTTQYRKGLGELVSEVRAAAPAVEPLDKLSFGCFGDEAFLQRLKSLGREQLLVTGIESHICVTQTVLGALEHGYQVHVASDATGSRSDANRDVGLRRMEKAGALLSSAEMALYELLRRSDAAAFKQLLPLLKG
jgi:nicotinamidase-related amidase